MRLLIVSAGIVVVGFLALAGCGRAGPAHPDPPAASGLADTATPSAAATDTAPPPSIAAAALLAAIPVEPVEGYVAPGGRPFAVALRSVPGALSPTRTFGTITRPIALRTGSPDLSQFPCSSCHLDERTVLDRERHRDAHQNIQPVHPERADAGCGSCHAPENVEKLALRGGGRATLDHAYRLCGECHFQQTTAWAAGAHGKRLDAWDGERVVMGCAECHDPHRPALEARIPFRAPRIARTERLHP
jgi:predicted small lipoprotein YifL